jgi:hypothetical protein
MLGYLSRDEFSSAQASTRRQDLETIATLLFKRSMACVAPGSASPLDRSVILAVHQALRFGSR